MSNMSNHPTLIDKLYEAHANIPNEVFLRQPYGDIWEEFTYDDVMNEALRLVSGMKSVGLKKGDKIGIYSKNCHQWVISEIAIMLGGYVTVPFYASLGTEGLKEVIKLSGIKFLFVGKLDNWENVKNAIPNDMPIVKFSPYKGGAEVDRGIDWNDFIKNQKPDLSNYRPALDDVWAIFFTSGTTGVPKGAVMTYAPPASLWIEQGKKHQSFNLTTPGKNTFLSYLPLNHIAEQSLIFTGSIYHEGQISFVESLYTFAKNLADTQPSVFLGVPNIWNNLRQGIIKKTPNLEALLRIPKVANQVKEKIRIAIGLNHTKLVISGASALPSATIKWFQNIGINIQETYGMTEAMGIVILQPMNDIRLNSTGKRLEECEIKLEPDNNEILIKNNWMFREYFNEPELTAESFTDDGFYRTGDTGDLDADGYLSIRGRVKDTFKTAKGLYIVPAPIENLFSSSELIEQICVVGLDLPQPIGLIKLTQISKGLNIEDIKQNLLDTLNKINNQLQVYERLNKLVVISDEWSIQTGFLTPTNKIKRNIIQETYKDFYKKWYQHSNKFVIS